MPPRSRLFPALVILFGSFSSTATVLPGRWTPVGPGGAPGDLAVASMNPAVVYAAASIGFFRSEDGGQTWRFLREGSDPVFTVDPRDDRHLLLTSADQVAPTEGQLEESRDGGETWIPKQRPPFPPHPLSEGGRITTLAIDPFERNTFYAAAVVYPPLLVHPVPPTRGALYKSMDAGETWAEVLSAGLSPTGLVVSRSTPGTLFFGAFGSGVWKSIDGGDTWSQIQFDLIGVTSLTGDRSNPLVLYAAVRGLDLFKTTDGGQTWLPASKGIDPRDSSVVQSVVVAPTKSMEVFANTPAGVYRSDDGAASWRLFAPSGNTVLAVDSLDADVIYLRQGNHLFRSNDGGRTLRDASNGLFASMIQSILNDPQGPSLLYAGGTGEFFFSLDAASTWTRIADGLPPDPPIVDLAVDPGTSSRIYAAVGSDVFKSIDGGASWSASSSGLNPTGVLFPPYVLSIATDPFFPGVLYAATEGAVFRSDDRAASWKKLDFPAVVIRRWVRTDPKTTGVVYLAAFEGAFKSTDFGATWRRIGDFAGVLRIAVDPGNGNRIYATATTIPPATTIFRSFDAGESWSPAVSGLTLPTEAIAVDPTRSERIYTIHSSTVFQSLDGGANWTSINNGLPQNVSISSLAVGANGIIYVGTRGSGIFSFQPIPDRPPIDRINNPRRVRSLGALSQIP